MLWVPCLLVAVLVLLYQRRRRRQTGPEWSGLDNLLKDLEVPRSGQPELAAVGGGSKGQREHVWRGPGGEEVFLN